MKLLFHGLHGLFRLIAYLLLLPHRHLCLLLLPPVVPRAKKRKCSNQMTDPIQNYHNTQITGTKSLDIVHPLKH